MYETVFGIFDHRNAKNRPLAIVAMHPQEDVHTNYSLRTALLNYTKHNIGEVWRMSLLEFLQLPSFITKELMEVADIAQKQKADILNDLMNNKPK